MPAETQSTSLGHLKENRRETLQLYQPPTLRVRSYMMSSLRGGGGIKIQLLMTMREGGEGGPSKDDR